MGIQKGLEEGRIDPKYITCHEKDDKVRRTCNNGPCGSYGWRKNRETGRYEHHGQKYGQPPPMEEDSFPSEEWRSGKIELGENVKHKKNKEEANKSIEQKSQDKKSNEIVHVDD